MPKKCIIKKYPNRRLYNTCTSKYITIDNIRLMVINQEPFKVVEKSTNEDITRNILLQVIVEQESGKGGPMFSVELLIQFIRNYGDETQENFTSFMEQSLNFFAKQQEMLQDSAKESLGKMGQQQIDVWQEMQKDFFKSLLDSSKDWRL